MEDKPSESVGEISESVARTGELVWRLLSYSSSASDSAYAVPESKFIVQADIFGFRVNSIEWKDRLSVCICLCRFYKYKYNCIYIYFRVRMCMCIYNLIIKPNSLFADPSFKISQ